MQNRPKNQDAAANSMLGSSPNMTGGSRRVMAGALSWIKFTSNNQLDKLEFV